ncbi:MAG: RluA family pseudouridine synthase [Myxococcales bacterium]|nr:MAG: RluA family pseudouridine synthase [Myxococcales bacterium]
MPHVVTQENDELIELSILESEEKERIDKVLAARDLGFSRSVLKRWIEEGRVRVDGDVVAAKRKVLTGQSVEIVPAPPPKTNLEPQDIPLEILYEDDALLVLNKPAGLVVHPAPGHPDGTLVNALLYHWQHDRGMQGIRPGIVHRLDKDTSGVMVVAKSVKVHEALVELFSKHDIGREYLAIVVGNHPLNRRIESLHGRHPVDRKRFSSKVEQGRRAVTTIETLERFSGAALIQCQLETGRTHQIRVHCADQGFPVLGDILYAKKPKDPRLVQAYDAVAHQALHARHLSFVHPTTKEKLSFRSEPPVEFEAALKILQSEKTS